MKMTTRISLLCTSIFSLALFANVASATHAWGSYHWGRTGNPFTLRLGDNVASVWDPHLATTSSDWSLSSILDTAIVPGKTTSRKCRATSGRVEVCANKYGFNGWLGIAQIWVNGDHVVQGLAKMNDSYFNTSTYNSPAWRNLVMCQEVAHTFGLGHQDEDFNNAPLGTCMDYSSDPTLNQHPNPHDYDMLEEIYAHLDTINTYDSSPDDGGGDGGGGGNGHGKKNIEADENLNHPAAWGKKVKDDLFVHDLGNDLKMFTFVFWTPHGQP